MSSRNQVRGFGGLVKNKGFIRKVERRKLGGR